MFDPDSPRDMTRLAESVRESYRRLESYRQARRELIKDFVGTCYGDKKTGAEMPVNMMALMVDVYLMHLAGNGPQVLLPTPRRDILPFVADLEAVVNQELQDMRFDKILRKWCEEAIFSIGVLKCGLVDGDYIELLPGQPQPTQEYFADIVDLDDFVFDTSAKTWDRVAFIGDRYQVNYDELMANPNYPIEAKAAFRNSDEPNDRYEERAQEIGMDMEPMTSEEMELRKKGWVWDVALPEEGLIVTYPDTTTVVKPLKVGEWDGVSTHPYHILAFTDVPGNIMPLAPGQVLKSLNRTLNALYRKLVNQAKRQKNLALFRHGEHDDAARIMKAKDGDLIPVTHPDQVSEVNFGGASPDNLAFSIQVRDLFSMLAGNLDAMGGLGPQSDTVGQDQLIQQTVSQKSAKMTRTVVDATVEVVRDLVYRIWNDPIRQYNARRSIAGTDVELAVTLNPGERLGDFHDFDIKIEPYSMQYRSPAARSRELVNLMSTLVFPAMPFMQQQGINVDIQKLLQLLSKYMDLPELQHILQFQAPPMPGTAGEEPRQPEVSHRTYERINRPGATRQGNDRTMQQLLSGGNPQPSQVASLGRPTGV